MKSDFGKAYRKVMMAWRMEEAGNYRSLARALHPDLNGSEPRVGDAMAKLGWLNSAVGEYLKLPGVGYAEKMDAGDIAEVFLMKSGDKYSVLKVAGEKLDNDLLETEAKRLKHLNKNWFISDLEATHTLDGKAVNQVEYVRRDTIVPLEFLDKGLDFRHVVWMARRTMSALAHTHKLGFVHGAVLPRHLLFGKEDHGLRLVDWCYSVDIGQKLKVMVTGQEDFYPPEIKSRGRVGPDWDIYMAARSLQQITDVPRKFRPWFEKATMGQARNRWQDAWDAYDKISEIALEVYGPPHFVEFPE